MTRNRQKFIFIIPLLILGIFLTFNFLLAADLETGIDYAATTGLGTQDIRVTLANIIRVALGLLGVVAVGLIIYGGAIWMTAQGNVEKIDKAKKVLIGATIGLMIILSSVAITTFILNSILNATGGGGGGATPCLDGQAQSCGSCGSQVCTSGGYFGPCIDPCGGLDYGYCEDPDILSDAPFICSLSPTLGSKGTYVTIKGGKFSAYVDENTAKVYFNKSFGASSTNEVEATIALCNGNPAWDANNIVVEVPNLTDLGNYYVNVVTGGGESKSKSSLSGTNEKYELTDGEPGPGIACLDPNFGKENDPVDVYGKRFGTNGSLIFRQDKNANANPWADEHLVSSVPGGAVTGDVYVQVGVNKSNNVYFRVTCVVNNDCLSTCCQNGNCVPAENCYPGPGQDCDSSSAETGCQAGVCQAGLTCDQNCTCQYPAVGTPCDANIATAVCDATDTKCPAELFCSVANNCTCQYRPKIDRFVPADGAPGNYITIYGQGFGEEPGQVYFTDGAQGLVPSGCGASDLWQDGQIIIEIPNGSIDGPIKVQTANNLTATSTASFDVNEMTRPSLCGVEPNTGIFGDKIGVSGKNFGNVKGLVQIGGIDFGIGTPIWSWTNTTVQNLLVPNIQSATLPVQVRVGGIYSNPFNFIVTQSATAPVIDHITPESAPTGKYITIFGSNFGNQPGTVYFKNTEPDENNWQAGEVSFPQACFKSGYWHDSQITVKVPDGIVTDSQIYIKTSAGQSSNKIDFNHCQNCPKGPDVCAITPSSGPIGTTDVTIYGDNLGNEPGSVEFFNGLIAPVIDQTNKIWWTKNQIGTGDQTGLSKGPLVVPIGVKTGNVTVIQNNLISNPVLFTVSDCRQTSICSAGMTCCNDGSCRSQCAEISANNCTYSYSFSTGTLPGGPPQVAEDILCEKNTQSPSPWKNTTNNCLNAMISARFNMPMDASTISAANIKVEKCNSGELFIEADCAASIDVSNLVYDEDNYDFIFDPVGMLEKETWYRVTLSGAEIRSSSKIYLDGDFNNQPGGDYIWHFRTGGLQCEPDHVVVTPGEKIVLESLAERQSYRGNAYAINCNLLNADDYPWTWSYEKNGFANVFGEPIILNPVDVPFTTATARDQGEVYIVAEINQGTPQSKVDGDNDLQVDLGKPQINNIWPIDGIVKQEVDTKVTIYGNNFGDTQGGTEVFFGATEANLADCANNWSDQMIMVEVPLAAYTNNGEIKPIKIVTKDKGESNPNYPTGHILAGQPIQFLRDDSKVYPFLCSLIPNIGLKGDTVIATGENFGDSNINIFNNTNYRLPSNVIFSGFFSGNPLQDIALLLSDVKSWVNAKINFVVPGQSEQADEAEAEVKIDISPATEPFIDSDSSGSWALSEQYKDANNDGVYTNGPIFSSNALPFSFKPVITLITPDNGPKKTWITISGYNFGNTAGKIIFLKDNLVIREFDYDEIKPPSPCVNTWSNRQIIAAIPDYVDFNLETYNLYIITAKGIESNKDKTFAINENPLAPGLCGFTVTSANWGLSLYALGDRFGVRNYDSAALTDLAKTEHVVFSDKKIPGYTNPPASACDPSAGNLHAAWCDKWIFVTTPNNSISGNVIVNKKIIIGKKCIGPSFAGFCFSGNYADEYQMISSNPVFLTIAPKIATPPKPGKKCTNDDDCRKNTDGTIDSTCFSKCVDDYCTPYVKNFSPWQGPLGSWVTLNGCHFGCSRGDVYFTGSDRTEGILKKDEKIFYNFNQNTDDLSGKGNNGFLRGSADIEQGFLNVEGAGLLTSKNDDRAEWLDWGSTNELTVSAWVNIAGRSGGIFTSWGGGNYSTYDQWQMSVNSNGLFRIYSNRRLPNPPYVTTAVSGYSSAGSFLTSQWNNFTMVLAYNSGQNITSIKGYINGVQKISSTVQGMAFRNDVKKLLIVGGQAWYDPVANSLSNPYFNFFNGRIDDFRLYTRALSIGEIQEIFNFGNENYASGLGYAKKALVPENQNCTFWNCSASGMNDQVIVEVPNIRSGSETVYEDDAISGPIEIIAGDTNLVDTTAVSAPPVVGEFISNFEVIQTAEIPPKICKIEPGKGNRGEIIKVYGDSLKFPSAVNFIPDTLLSIIKEPFRDNDASGAYENGEDFIDLNKNTVYDLALAKAIYTFPGNSGDVAFVYGQGDCPQSASDPQEKIVCFAVPASAAGEGTGELTAKDSVSIRRGGLTSNALSFITTFTSGTTDMPLAIKETVPYNAMSGFCRNGIVDLYFDGPVDRETINQNNFSIECTSATPVVKDSGFISRGLSLVKNIIFRIGGFEQLAVAQNASYQCPHVLTQDEYSLRYYNLNGATTVSIVPRDLLRAGTTYRISVLGGVNGVKSIRGAQLDTNLSPIPATDKYVFEFSSAGDAMANELSEDNGICRINNIHVLVYSQEGQEARLAEDYTDLFTCAGDNCKLEFDWDQSDVLSGNQHRYELIAKFSGGVSVKAKFTWLKSDILDPKRALSFAALENAGADDLDQDANEYKFSNNTGNVYVTVAPIKETVPHLIIQGQAQGVTSNIYTQYFTVYVLLCQNPWPSLDERTYPSEQINAYKFGTWYCRDAGDPNKTDDDLPEAG